MADFLLPLGTLAFGGVGGFALAAMKFRQDTAKLRQDQEDRKLAAARCVSAWCDLQRSDHEAYVICVGNTGDQAVYNSVVFVATGNPKHPSPTEIVLMTIPPKQTMEARAEIDHLGDVPHFPHVPSVQVAFTDANGRHWLRTEDGRLEEQDRPPPIC